MPWSVAVMRLGTRAGASPGNAVAHHRNWRNGEHMHRDAREDQQVRDVRRKRHTSFL